MGVMASKSRLVRVIVLLRFNHKINNCNERDKLSFWSDCNEAFGRWCCNGIVIGTVVITSFYKLK